MIALDLRLFLSAIDRRPYGSEEQRTEPRRNRRARDESTRHTRAVANGTSRETAQLLQRVIEAVEKGELEARTPNARALLRRLEGALIALQASSPTSTSKHVHDSALRKPRD
jgi:hypothetical protein